MWGPSEGEWRMFLAILIAIGFVLGGATVWTCQRIDVDVTFGLPASTPPVDGESE